MANEASRTKVNIIGGGAMGIAMAYFLGIKNDVYLTVREGTLDQFSDVSVIFEGRKHRVNALVVDHLEDAEITIIAVKSYDLKSVLEQYNIRGKILLIQNGLSHLGLSQRERSFYYAVTTIGARTISRGVSEITGVGYFRVGGKERLDLSFFDGSGIRAEWVDNIEAEIYRKAAINAVINPLTAIFKVENRLIVEEPNIREISMAATGELTVLFNKIGYKFDIWKDIVDTCTVTGRNLSSTLQDITMGRRTEIDSITGEILKMADKFDIKMPINFFLYNAVKFLEKN
ncbi:MAG: ketopantoate reductase family protein, partial [Thermoplasmatales archaeon]